MEPAGVGSEGVRLGAGSGFWGDALDPAIELVERGELDYLGLDFLAELTMALLQRQRARRPEAGYVSDTVDYLRALLPPARETGTRIVCNGGGANPQSAAAAVREMVEDLGFAGTRIATVEGDDVLDRLDDLLAAGYALPNTDTGAPELSAIRDRIVAANVYLGASGIVEALGAGADVVIAGRVSDSALYIGPLMHELGWGYHQPDLIGAGITVGHIIECAAGVTGGMSSRWAEMPDMGRVGFPIVEMERDGSAVITKPVGSGGRVDQWTVKEHLAYETVDPARYATPDGVADFTTLQLEDLGGDRVRLTGMSGAPRPEHLKLIVGYEDGWIGEGMMFFPWPDALDRAEKARVTLMERFARLDLRADDVQVSFIGVNMLHGPAAASDPPAELNEVGLRVAARTRTREEAEKVRRACAQLWIMGPGGTSFGAPIKPRPVISLWPTLLPASEVRQVVRIEEVGSGAAPDLARAR